jgi:hypothetical protein
MLKCKLKGIKVFWDTGATSTTITTDILDKKFRAYLSNPIHGAYKNQDGPRVQLSFTLKFTNSLFSMDPIAWVVDKNAFPNARLGIILGQKGCIDALQYRSIPRSILETKGETIDKRFWGGLILEGYVDLDGT